MSYDYQSSLPAYLEDKQGKAQCKLIVLETIKKLQPVNDREISEFLHWPINRVTPRRGELIEDKKVMEHEKKKDPNTGRKVSYWRIVPEVLQQGKIFLD